jgi:DUF3095 family protein
VQPVTADVYAHLSVFDDFARLTDPALYTSLPDEWVLGISDIVQSTAAIAAGRYKVVNTAAAAVIAAVANALGEHDFPFVFGGDGASFALPPEHAELARSALASVAAWVRDDLELKMRVAAWCTDQGWGRTDPNPVRGQATRTYFGRPSSSMRLST